MQQLPIRRAQRYGKPVTDPADRVARPDAYPSDNLWGRFRQRWYIGRSLRYHPGLHHMFDIAALRRDWLGNPRADILAGIVVALALIPEAIGFSIIAYDQPPLTRRERADQVKKRNYFTKYGDKARAVLEALLDKYADEGISTIEDTKVLKLRPFDAIGTPLEIIKGAFGGKAGYEAALSELENQIYEQASNQ